MRHFVTAWYTAAAAAAGMSSTKRDERATGLRRAITVREDLRRIGVRPLLMTIMALVHFNDQGQLPEERVTLYNRCVDLLLGQWELAREDGSAYGALMDFIELPDSDVKTLRPLLETAAFEAHAASSADSPGSLGAATLRDLVATFLDERKHPNPFHGARRFLEYTDVRAGLLQASDAGDAYVFPHLTFQEYLAGRALVSGVGVVERIWERRTDDRWRVPIFLGVGDHVTDGKLEMPLALLMRLLHEEGREPAQAQRDFILAAEIAEDVGWVNLERGGAPFRRLRTELAKMLADVVEGKTLPARERVRAGELLGVVGDLRTGVCDLPPAMVAIRGGSFVIGSSKAEAEAANKAYGFDFASREINDQSLRITDFEIARYPVTNAQFERFIAADGYNPDAPWWSIRQTWLAKERVRAPRFWGDLHFGIACPNHPVVGVNWYEAMAFCAWLTTYLHDGYEYGLPSEAEWEYAARGAERRVYPWGSDPEPGAERASFDRLFDGTTTVGCFSLGGTPEELLDMAGNVWEWTRSAFRPYPYDPADGREDPSDPAEKRFTLRGVSWYIQPINLRAAFRVSDSPDDLNLIVGFRLARRPPHVKR
jgi:formylglycine-generating enzyme required for sulfatase activity